MLIWCSQLMAGRLGGGGFTNLWFCGTSYLKYKSNLIWVGTDLVRCYRSGHFLIWSSQNAANPATNGQDQRGPDLQ